MSDHKLTIETFASEGFLLRNENGTCAVSVGCVALGFEVDAEQVRDFFEGLRPKPPYVVECIGDCAYQVRFDETDVLRASFIYKKDAEEYADLLNEREAQ